MAFGFGHTFSDDVLDSPGQPRCWWPRRHSGIIEGLTHREVFKAVSDGGAVATIIGDATEGDLPGVLAIYNDAIATSTAVYRDEPADLEDRRRWWRDRREQGYPVLVAADDTGVVGFASFGDFRPWPGYRYTVEHMVYVRAGRRGNGVGRSLMLALIARAVTLDKHVMVAGVDAGNAASIRFHERLGFERVAHFREVGFKFGRWLDLVFLQHLLPRRMPAQASSDPQV